MINQSEFKERLSRLVTKRTKSVNAGGCTGSIFALDFSDQTVDRADEKNVTDDCLMVKCSWRLDDIKHVRPVTGWQEDSDEQGVMTLRLKSLINDIVNKVEISPFNDLEIFFESGKRLFVFCDMTPYVEGDFNWFLKTSEGIYAVNLNLKCIFERNQN